MSAVRKPRMLAGLGAAIAAAMLAPAAAQATEALEGCLVSKQNTFCSDPSGDGDAHWSDARFGAYTSEEAYFHYHGTGPWTIQYPGNIITCPAQTVCVRFIPEVVVAQYSQILVRQTKGGNVFVGALVATPGQED